MSMKKHILPIVFGVLILLLSFESPSLLINELNERNTEEKETEEELNEANYFEGEYLKTLSSDGNPTLTSIVSVFDNSNKRQTYPQKLKKSFITQPFKAAFQVHLYILFCSLKLYYY